MSGEIQQVLALEDGLFYQALGRSIFGQDAANVQDEFNGYTKTTVEVIDGKYKSEAIILVKEYKVEVKDKGKIQELIEKDIVVISEKGDFDINLEPYFSSLVNKQYTSSASQISFFSYNNLTNSRLLTASGATFNLYKTKKNEEPVVKGYDFNYNPQSPLKLTVQGIYKEKTLKPGTKIPALPTTLRVGYSGERNFLLVGFSSEDQGKASAQKVGISFIPARSVLQNVLANK